MFISINAQVDSVKEALKYYPLHIGDYWQYKVTSQSSGHKDTSWIGYKEVIGDTLMPNDKKYFAIKEDRITYPYQPYYWPRFIRIDSTTANIYEYDRGNFSEYKIDSLLSKEGDIFLNYGSIKCTKETTKVIFGNNVKTKLMEDNLLSSTGYSGWELAQGYGEVMRYYDDIFVSWVHYQCDLIYAEIGGAKYGVKTNVHKLEDLPNQFRLLQNYPNPFNSTTTIKYQLLSHTKVSLKIFDVLGREIVTLVDREQDPGNFKVIFNATDLSSGIYFYRLQTNTFTQINKMLLLK